jgi:hypothetical protein
MIEAKVPADRAAHAVHELHERRRHLRDWLQTEETSREGAHERKSEVLRGRLQEIEWALELLEP